MLAETQRRRLLDVMGIDVYVLRAPPASAATPIFAVAAVNEILVVACARDPGDAQTARLRAALPLALGIDATRIQWLQASAGGALPPPPAAAAYLALGAEMPRALGVHLSTMQQNSAVIAAADAPSACLRDGLSRRALWQALKPVARRLRAGPN